MAGVVDHGTAAAAKLPLDGIQMAGKTGTAQTHNLSAGERGDYTSATWKLRDHSLFMAFVPFNNPRYAAGAIVEHGGFGASVAAPLVRDTLLFLYDKQKAIQNARRVRAGHWRDARGADRAQDHCLAPGQRTSAASRRQAGMITSAIIPRPLARLPWRLIFLVAAIAMFGLVVLYSAAGGSAEPWAVKQGIIFLFFLGVAIGMSWLSESTIKSVAFPLYGLTLIMLVGVEALGFVSKGAQRWLDLGPCAFSRRNS